jgi:hypothetical protein
LAVAEIAAGVQKFGIESYEMSYEGRTEYSSVGSYATEMAVAGVFSVAGRAAVQYGVPFLRNYGGRAVNSAINSAQKGVSAAESKLGSLRQSIQRFESKVLSSIEERAISRSATSPRGIKFNELDSGAKNIISKLTKGDEVIKRVKWGQGPKVQDIRAASEFLEREIAVVKSKSGEISIILGDETGIPVGSRLPDEQFLLHTHPVYESIPKDFTIDIANATNNVEAVVDWGGNITHFDKSGIISNPSISPINKHGHIVGY